MKVWDELLKLNIGNKEKFQSLFSYYVNKIKEGKLDLSPGEFLTIKVIIFYPSRRTDLDLILSM
ncbi:hypothetical protein J4482_04250 [Candidatus Woesearchaeota archaeon]|nr:hypothetical protein [Candidatus Woesearchaeota archaeon]